MGSEEKKRVGGSLSGRCKMLLDHLDHAFVWEMDKNQRVSFVSERSEVLLGYSRERWLNEPMFWASCAHPEDRGMLTATLASALDEGKDQRCDHRFVSREGRSLWFHTGIHAARDDAGSFFWLVSVDITPAKRVEEQMRDQLDFTRAITGSLGEGVLAMDLEGRVTFCNPAAAKLLGTDEETLLGQKRSAVVEFRRADGTAFGPGEGPLSDTPCAGQDQAQGDLVLQGPGGHPFPVNFTSARIMRGGRCRGGVLTFQDTSEQKETQRLLQEDEHLRAIGVLAEGIAHETNNPLTFMTGSIELAARSADALEDHVDAAGKEGLHSLKSRLVRALQGSERIAAVVRGVMAFARSDADHRGPVDVRDALESAAQLASSKIEGLARLQRNYNEVPMVRGSRSQLSLAFLQLLINATQAIAQGDPDSHTIRLTTRLGPEGSVLVEVSDTGSGISPGHQARIFEPFFTTKSPGRGMGLGLSAVYRIVKEIGGAVFVASSPGKGATFRVQLPAYRPT